MTYILSSVIEYADGEGMKVMGRMGHQERKKGREGGMGKNSAVGGGAEGR